MKTSRSLYILLTILLVFTGFAYYDSNIRGNNNIIAYNDDEKEDVVISDELLKETEKEEDNNEDKASVETISNEVINNNIAYDNMTLEELGSKLDRTFTANLSGKGYIFAKYALELGVDPYIGAAIVMHETGCSANGCSYLVNACNNIGGMKGSGCGAYGYFATLDDGIYAFLSNLSRNYFSMGLNTPDTIGPKYAEDPLWSSKVKKHVETIKNN